MEIETKTIQGAMATVKIVAKTQTQQDKMLL